MSLVNAILFGLLAAASIVQALLLARTTSAGRSAANRLATLEEGFRLTESDPPVPDAVVADAADTLPPDLAARVEPAVAPSPEPRPHAGAPPARVPEMDSPAAGGPARFVGGLNT